MGKKRANFQKNISNKFCDFIKKLFVLLTFYQIGLNRYCLLQDLKKGYKDSQIIVFQANCYKKDKLGWLGLFEGQMATLATDVFARSLRITSKNCFLSQTFMNEDHVMDLTLIVLTSTTLIENILVFIKLKKKLPWHLPYILAYKSTRVKVEF